MPGAGAGIDYWDNLDPLEAGVGDLPPAVDAPDVSDRLVTWLRVRSGSTTDVKLRWIGVNAAQIRQQLLVSAEQLAPGDGAPDQVRQLRQSPVLAGSVTVTSIENNTRHDWKEIDDLRAAGPELPIANVPDMGDPVEVFSCDRRSGPDPLRRRPHRPPAEARRGALCELCLHRGRRGQCRGLHAQGRADASGFGLTATNPVPTWGGAEAESVAAAEKQIPRFITHRDRLVTADDFRAIAWRTPGVAIGRVEVLPAAHPDIAPLTIGSAPAP